MLRSVGIFLLTFACSESCVRVNGVACEYLFVCVCVGGRYVTVMGFSPECEQEL